MENTKKMLITFEEVPWYADVIPIRDFIHKVDQCVFMDCDGFGYLAKEDDEGKIWESPIPIQCYSGWLVGCIEDFTHVCWYSK